ncbi:MAG: hypothetical protein QOI95_3267 [Acidimicrobiaceae bacterium]
MIGEALDRHFRLEATEHDKLELTPLGERARGIPRVVVEHDVEWSGNATDVARQEKRKYRGKRVILLVRDPHDAIVSLYFHVTKRHGRRAPYEGSMAQFLREASGSLDTLSAYYNAWARDRDVPAAMLLVRYEDLHHDAPAQLARLLAFLGVADVSVDVLDSAVDAASFSRMRSLEEADALGTRRLRAKRADDPDSFKTRRGQVGGYADYLSTADIDWLEARLEGLDPWFGYGGSP